MTASNSIPLAKYAGMTTTPCSYSIEPLFTSLISSMPLRASYATALSAADLHIIAIVLYLRFRKSEILETMQRCSSARLDNCVSTGFSPSRSKAVIRSPFGTSPRSKFDNRFCGSVAASQGDCLRFVRSV